ncbi:Enamine deaminase RidA, house cleaning of reactive enamine intermediates, YjgF/YER057c/UK114 family [Sphingobium sp. AP50]|uniref:RidA family protein n=1 Tax=Sphingobium sp. AP50 TaxID=1884369 RepID=UPI0008C0EE12|nr:RidA family protein [Sphingobium sp. AP50]SEI71148.1 Enamine deaminase RidA, house cleaning of reactive enamine intermediates, YjgF/YER057c/UK114 family [Sphingobium sp. AP50]
MKAAIAALTLAAMATGSAMGSASAATVEHKQTPGAMIASAAIIPPGSTFYYLSGATAAPINPADTDSADAYGDTEAQAMSIFTKMKAQLGEMGLTMGDVVKLTVFLVGDPKQGGKMDRDGLTRAYKKFFGTADQPNLPTRSAFQISALARPQQLIEIEGVAAKAP